MEYGLIGSKLGHSYSKIIHEMLCGYRYDLCPLPTEEEARAFLTRRQFKAINVTIPYKRLVMEYCTYIDPRAKAIGAVNTVVNKNGLLYGYNTDHLGFAHLCDAHGVDFAGRTVLILGTGGTHNTTSAVARDKGAAKVLTVSRTPDAAKGQLSYEEAVASGAQIVINTTPAGMYPNVGVCSLDVAKMPGLEAVLDVVYNPDKTELILRAEEAGVPVAVGGLEMLVAQAVYAAEYFLSRKFDDAAGEIGRITAALRRDMLNVALIGMPSSGKSTVGRALAERLGKKFIDLDEEIVKADGRSIPDIFAAEGEDGFRAKESAQTARYAAQARALARAIDAHFGGEVGGYDTYRYYAGNTLLRSWICMPLIVGLKERSEGTVRALLGPELMTDDGLLTQQGSSTFWDRSTLYALRGIYNVGQADRATELLHRYSQRRLLGDHVPYPIEAWPEGSQRHLSAESGLYCRIITEGLFGIRPTGLRSFDLTPSMPAAWESMSLRHIRAFGSDFDITVARVADGRLRITVARPGAKPKIYRAAPGATIRVKLTD